MPSRRVACTLGLASHTTLGEAHRQGIWSWWHKPSAPLPFASPFPRVFATLLCAYPLPKGFTFFWKQSGSRRLTKGTTRLLGFLSVLERPPAHACTHNYYFIKLRNFLIFQVPSLHMHTLAVQILTDLASLGSHQIPCCTPRLAEVTQEGLLL